MTAPFAIFPWRWPILIIAISVCLAALPGCSTPQPVYIRDLPEIPAHLAQPPIPLKPIPRLKP